MAESINASEEAEIEPTHNLICQLCKENGGHLKAEGYCQECVVYLCKPCVKYHKKLPGTRAHTLLTEDDMPQNTDQAPISPPDVCTDKCTEHGDIVKYYGNDHSKFGCTVCITLDHRNCNIGYIPKLSMDVVQGQEYTDLMKTVNLLIDRSASIENDAVTDKNQSDQLETKLLEDINKYRTEINQLLDRIVCNIKAKTEKVRKRNYEYVRNISEKSKLAKEGLTAMRDNFATLANNKQFYRLFRYIKNVKSTMMEMEEELDEIDNVGITQYKLSWQNVECLLDMVEVKFNEPSHFSCAHKGDIRVRSDKDSDTCIISGIVMMPEYNDKLVMVDRNNENNSIKVVDRSKKILTTELRLSACPGDIASFQTNKLAVTFPNDQKIAVIKWNNDRESLSIDKEFTMDGACRGITCLQDNLVVTYTDPGKVEIIDHIGKTIQTFSKDQNGYDLFSSPCNVAVSADGQSIYVSDGDKDTVTCLGLDGNVKAIYIDDKLKSPRGVYVDSFGTVFVCGFDSHNIHVLSPDLRKVKVLLQDMDGIFLPYPLYLCEDTDQLYVGMCDNNDIKGYQLTRYNGYNAV